jgi:hypothetical protein
MQGRIADFRSGSGSFVEIQKSGKSLIPKKEFVDTKVTAYLGMESPT